MTFLNVVRPGDNYPLLELSWAPTTQPTAGIGAQTFVDITPRLREWEWSYGRNDELGDFGPGSGYVLLDNRDRAFDPMYEDGPWYGDIKPRRAFQMNAKVGATTKGVFIGYARGFPQQWPAYGQDAVVRIDLIDQLAFLATFELPVGFSRGTELSGARINAALDAIGYPAAYRDIDDGTVYIDAINVETAGTTAFAHIRDCAAVEFGQFFDFLGTLTFHDRRQRLNPDYEPFLGDIPTLSDDRDRGLCYDNTFALAYDDTYLATSVRVDGSDPATMAPGTASSAAGTADYWPVTKAVTLPVAYEPDRTALAQYQLLRYEEPEYRAPAVNCSMAGQPSDDERLSLLSLGISDLVFVERLLIVLKQIVEGVGHTCRVGGPWTVTVQTSPADIRAYWTLEDAALGALDNSDIVISP